MFMSCLRSSHTAGHLLPELWVGLPPLLRRVYVCRTFVIRVGQHGYHLQSGFTNVLGGRGGEALVRQTGHEEGYRD